MEKSNEDMIKTLTKTDRRNAYLYCKFRDEQYALSDEYAKRHGFSMRSLLIVNAFYYAKDGMTQKEICLRTFNSKQTISLIIKRKLLIQKIRLSYESRIPFVLFD